MLLAAVGPAVALEAGQGNQVVPSVHEKRVDHISNSRANDALSWQSKKPNNSTFFKSSSVRLVSNVISKPALHAAGVSNIPIVFAVHNELQNSLLAVARVLIGWFLADDLDHLIFPLAETLLLDACLALYLSTGINHVLP